MMPCFIILLPGSDEEAIPMLRVHKPSGAITPQPALLEESEECISRSQISSHVSTASIETLGGEKVPPRHVQLCLGDSDNIMSVKKLYRHSIGEPTGRAHEKYCHNVFSL